MGNTLYSEVYRYSISTVEELREKWKGSVFVPILREAINVIIVIVAKHCCYQVHTKFTLHSSVNVKSTHVNKIIWYYQCGF
jgi:hypothetical protein